MAYTVGDAIDKVSQQGGFDTSASNTSRPVVMSWLSTKHQQMVRRSRCYQDDATLGTTVADQSKYTLDQMILEVYTLEVGGTPYSRIGQRRYRKLTSGWLGLRVAGVFTPDYSSPGSLGVGILPAPDHDGDAITGWVALSAPTLTSEGGTFLVPADEWVEAIVDGAIGIGQDRVNQNPYVAESYEQTFTDATEELRRMVNSRISGGASTVQVTA
jgi:hypothetical protein